MFNQSGDNLIVGMATVPRNPNILKEWGIVQDHNLNGKMSFQDEGGDVEIEVTCPSSLVKGLTQLRTNGGGLFCRKLIRCCSLDELKLDLSPSVPILLWMHGGGFTVGSTRDFSSKLAYELCNNPCDEKKQKGQPIILLSINYRCAPEKPFPASVIDCLSVAEFLMEKLNSPIHIAGFSAGGNLASVTAFESMRRYPVGKLKSLVAIDPALSPMIYNLKSYQMNVLSSSFCPPSFLIWSWAKYLQLASDCDISKYREELEKSCIFTASSSSSDKAEGTPNPLVRLLCPYSSVPKELRLSHAPRIIVKTSSGCPLEDDGLHLIQQIKEAGGSVVALRGKGSHGIATVLDIKSSNEFISQWASIIWP